MELRHATPRIVSPHAVSTAALATPSLTTPSLTTPSLATPSPASPDATSSDATSVAPEPLTTASRHHPPTGSERASRPRLLRNLLAVVAGACTLVSAVPPLLAAPVPGVVPECSQAVATPSAGAVHALPARMVGTTIDRDATRGKDIGPIFARAQAMHFNAVRLGAYWDETEPQPGKYDFKTLDAQLDAAEENNLAVILSVGSKAPGWPEFYLPPSVHPKPSNGVLDSKEFCQSVTAFDRAVVQHVAGRPNVVMFQVENEPLDPSGPQSWRISPQVLAAEVQAVRTADGAHRPILINVWSQPRVVVDNDPFGTIKVATQLADVIGLDIYPNVGGNNGTQGAEGRVQTFPTFAMRYATDHGKRAMVTELQADDWSPYKTNPHDVAENMHRANQQGYKDILFWRQSMVESQLQQGDHALETIEGQLASPNR